MASPPFTPKQAVPFEGKLLKELQGDVTDSVAKDLMIDNDIPDFLSTSVVHDNGCGYGACTMALMSTNPPKGLQIHATDVNPMFIAQLQATLAQNPSWPVKVENMDACSQAFPNNTFTHSFTMFVFSGLTDDIGAAKHILRTLQPGGTGVVTVWSEMPWHLAFQNAHHKTRGENEPMAPYLSMSWYKKEKLEQVLTDAGCKDVKFIQKSGWAVLGTDLRHWVTIAWTFLAAPVGGWQQRDEDKWDEAIDSIVKELVECESHKVENGIHKIRMVADVAIMRKV